LKIEARRSVRRNSFRRQIGYVAFGAALAAAGVCLEIFRPGPIQALLVPLPSVYAATLAGFLFWIRGREAAGREKAFWQLWAAGSWLWAVAGMLSFFILNSFQFSDQEIVRLALTFLPQALFMAALVMQPEIAAGQLRDPVVGYEAALVALWWVSLYVLILSPWHLLQPNHQLYFRYFVLLHNLQVFSAIVWLIALGVAARGAWRRAYLHLAAALALFSLSIGGFLQSWANQRWLPTMAYQAAVAASFLWLSLTTLISTESNAGEPGLAKEPTLGAGAWVASITAIGIPVMAIWFAALSSAPEPVRRFRLFVCFATFVSAVLLLYRWQEVTERQQERLVAELETSVKGLRRLQGHFAEAEKLASLGQLAAGAAHEINNPVAAMQGYSELLRSNPTASGRVHEFGRKIGEQTRRIRNLVQNLLSLAEHESRETSLVDVTVPLRGALELCRVSGGYRGEKFELRSQEGLPLQVQGDEKKLLQVFYRLLLALSEGDCDTQIEVQTGADDAVGRVLIEFIGRPIPNTGGKHAPETYNARRAQQGNQLSLNVCYAIVEEHGGTIAHENLIDGGKIFRVELPAAGAPHAVPSSVSGA
jgi:signal transduction histidine kinase